LPPLASCYFRTLTSSLRATKTLRKNLHLQHGTRPRLSASTSIVANHHSLLESGVAETRYREGVLVRLASQTLPRARDMAEGIKAAHPPFLSSSPAPLAEDFARQQISKQLRGNFHSTSLTTSLPTMVSAVNKTALHPAGLQYVHHACCMH
jgi:hypothetical protein